MKHIFLAVVALLFFTYKCKCQEKSSQWELKAGFGIEEHDKRLFGAPGLLKKDLLDLHKEFFGTYNSVLDFHYHMVRISRIGLLPVVGFNYQVATFTRPFNHQAVDPDNRTEILMFVNKYEKLKLSMGLQLLYIVNKRWSIDAGGYFKSLIFSDIDDYYKRWHFDFDQFEIVAGLNHQRNNITFRLGSRAFNYQKIDKVLFYNAIRDPRTDQIWERINPLQIDFSIGYRW